MAVVTVLAVVPHGFGWCGGCGGVVGGAGVIHGLCIRRRGTGLDVHTPGMNTTITTAITTTTVATITAIFTVITISISSTTVIYGLFR